MAAATSKIFHPPRGRRGARARGRKRTGRWKYAATAIVALSACLIGAAAQTDNPPSAAAPTPGLPRAPIHTNEQAAAARKEREFARAMVYKPKDQQQSGLAWTLAPLIVHELADADGEDDPGPFWGTHITRRSIESAMITVHAEVLTVNVAGARFAVVDYTWNYSSREAEFTSADATLRIVVGPDGYPIVWQAKRWAENESFIFVSESFERLAREQFGEPLPGQRYACQSGWGGFTGYVTGTLPDGPVPMGHYVYLDAPDRRITTVLCRCSPSPMRTVVNTREYQLDVSDGSDEPAPPLRPLLTLELLLRWPRFDVPAPTDTKANDAP